MGKSVWETETGIVSTRLSPSKSEANFSRRNQGKPRGGVEGALLLSWQYVSWSVLGRISNDKVRYILVKSTESRSEPLVRYITMSRAHPSNTDTDYGIFLNVLFITSSLM